MTDINNLTISGRIVQDIKLGYVGNNMAMAKFSVAVNRSVKGADGQWQDVASFVDVTAWGKTAEWLNQTARKGTKVLIVGRIEQQACTDKQTNQQKSKVAVIADRVELLMIPQQVQPQQAQPQQAQPQYTPANYAPPATGFDGSFSEDVPF
jgi:single-strand DNA-binding protein